MQARATNFAKEYGKELYLRRQIAEQILELTGNMRVFCRVRPPSEEEATAPMAVTALDDTTVLLQDTSDKKRPTRRFEFNQVRYRPDACHPRGMVPVAETHAFKPMRDGCKASKRTPMSTL